MFCSFRNKLIKQGNLDLLLNEINTQLEEVGLKVKSADIAIAATIINSNARPKKTLDQEEDGNYETSFLFYDQKS